jgi:hypothetical protein
MSLSQAIASNVAGFAKTVANVFHSALDMITLFAKVKDTCAKAVNA